MNVRKLKQHLGNGVNVSRDRKTRTVNLSAHGLSYRADEAAFKNEAELAEYARSKMPVINLVPAR